MAIPSPIEMEFIRIRPYKAAIAAFDAITKDLPPQKELTPEPDTGKHRVYRPRVINPHATILNDGFNPLATNKPKPTRVPSKPEKPKMSQEISQVLEMNSSIIQRLAEDLDIAQTKCVSLTVLTGSNYRATRARKLLMEQGLIEKVGKGYIFTPMALELGLGTYTRKPDSEYQVLRYSPKVMDYITPVQEKRKPVVPFKLLNPQGEVVVVENVKSFSEANGLHSGKVYQLVNGICASHKGFKLPV